MNEALGFEPQVSHGLLDAVADTGRMDVVADYAEPLPVMVIAELAERRRSTPGDDLVTHLVQVEEAGEKLTEREPEPRPTFVLRGYERVPVAW